MGTGKHITF